MTQRDWSLSQRLLDIPPYIFSEINVLKAEAEKAGIKLKSLAIGDPDLPTPSAIVERIAAAAANAKNHGYSPYEGTLAFRHAVSQWLQKRFGIQMDPQREIISLIGSKEGLAHFPLAVCNPGDRVLYPSPGYPVFQTSLILAGVKPIPYSHVAEENFAPNPERFEKLIKEHRPKVAILNYPSNPTSVTCSRETMQKLVHIALEHSVILLHDNAYSELYFDEKDKPFSIFEIPEARENSIELHSLSKSYNMTGWRLGFAIGNSKLVSALLKVKTNIDSGPLLTVQEAGIFALENSHELSEPIRQTYRERLNVVLPALDRMGLEYLRPRATFFIWIKVPGKRSSMQLTKDLIQKEGLVVTPGVGFGQEGEGSFRLAMTQPNDSLVEALGRLERFFKA